MTCIHIGKRCLVYLKSYQFPFQITGGSSGIGKAMAKEAIRRGAVVSIMARNNVWEKM